MCDARTQGRRLPGPLLLLAWLAASTAAAVELAPDDVPLNCIDICGPMVELSVTCNVDTQSSGTAGTRRVRKRNHPSKDFVDGALRRRGLLNSILGLVGADGKTTVTTVKTLPQSSTLVEATTTRSIGSFHIIPTPTSVAAATTSAVLAAPPATTRAATTEPVITTATATATTESVMMVPWATESSVAAVVGGAAAATTMYRPDQKLMGQAAEEAEAQCLCENTSFDVKAVAPLCASCILMTGDQRSPMNEILAECNFTSTSYSPEKTSLVHNIEVKATRPVLAAGANVTGAVLGNGAARAGFGSVAGFVVIGFLCAAGLLV